MSTPDDFAKRAYEALIWSHIVYNPCSDQTAYLAPTTGVPPGLFCATSMFNFEYNRALCEYHQEVSQD
eukprot:12893871-Prorocentrum_lima.AAC.1